MKTVFKKGDTVIVSGHKSSFVTKLRYPTDTHQGFVRFFVNNKILYQNFYGIHTMFREVKPSYIILTEKFVPIPTRPSGTSRP